MEKENFVKIIADQNPGAQIKYLGGGSDSAAYRVGDLVYRCTLKGVQIYEKEAAVCNFIRPNITAEIPDIHVTELAGGGAISVHKMLVGDRWSWHKFMWRPRRQRNLAYSAAEFLAQLHATDTRGLVRAVPEMAKTAPYLDFELAVPVLRPLMTARELEWFRRTYNEIVGAPVDDADIVLNHMGLKGANSVVWPDGTLRGVYDFGNAIIAERSRDIVLFYLSRNRRLYNQMLDRYQKLTGQSISRRRVRDLAMIEFMWSKRWYVRGNFVPRGRHALRCNLVPVLMRRYRLPSFMRPVMRLILTVRQKIRDR